MNQLEQVATQGPDKQNDTGSFLDLAGTAQFSRTVENRVLTAPSDLITENDFRDLVTGQLDALRVRDFIAPQEALEIAQAFLAGEHTTNYRNLKDKLEKIGTTLFEACSTNCAADSSAIDEYLNRAVEIGQVISSICEPFGKAPMDRVEQFLQETLGAEPLCLQGRKAFAGLIRVVREGSEILPHTDFIGEDMPSLDFAVELKRSGSGQLAGNVYLQMPSQGGELQLWRNKALSAAPMLASSDYAIDPSTLPAPDCVIRPAPGELIFFDSCRVHCVTKGGNPPRVSVSFFLGLLDKGKSMYWS